MFEKYMIVEKESHNWKEDGKIEGFQVGARVPYYRGLGVSMIEDIQLSVDGEAIPSDQLLIELHGNHYTLKEMESEQDDRWEFGEIGNIKVKRQGGLSSGEHKIDMLFNLRISYMPVNGIRRDSKTIKF
jgi:hypothetical protein